MNHLASHGFIVVASLSTTPGSGSPLPTIVGLDWILQQAEDSTSPYYHRLDAANIGALGHSYGGMSTCMSASEPRYKALSTICGTSASTAPYCSHLAWSFARWRRCSSVEYVEYSPSSRLAIARSPGAIWKHYVSVEALGRSPVSTPR